MNNLLNPRNRTGMVKQYVAFAFKRPLWMLAMILAVGIAAAVLAASRLRVVTDLESLLPQGTPSVRALDESRRRIGATNFFVMAVASRSNDAVRIAGVQDALKARIENEWSDAVWVQVARETAFFKDHALYYIEAKKLRSLEKILNEAFMRVSAQMLPGSVNLLDDSGSEDRDIASDIAAWLDEDALVGMGFPPQIERALVRFFGNGRARTKTPNETEDENVLPENLRDRLISPEGEVGVVLVQLCKPSSDFDYAQHALARGESLIRAVLSDEKDADLTVQVVGAYRSFKEVDAVAGDGRIATSVSAALVLAMLFLFFRTVRMTAAVFIPVAVAGALTMGVAALVFGRLTVFTVFVLALLAGMGIDYGIHLFGRVRSEIQNGTALDSAVACAVADAGLAVMVAALTTIGCLLVLLVGHFNGFKEFAVVAAIGIAFSALTAVVTMPPLVAAVSRVRPLFNARSQKATHRSARRVRRVATVAFGLGLLITAVLTRFASRVDFEDDFRNLRGQRTGRTISYGPAIGKKASTSPSIILGKDRKQMSAVHAFLLNRLGKDARVNSFITADTFVPSSDEQAKRHAIIKSIGAIVNKRAMNRLDGEAGRWIVTLRRMSRAEPFTDADLPLWTRKMLTEKDGTFGAVGQLYAKVKDWDAKEVQDYQDAYGTLYIDGAPILLANSAFILSDVVKMVKADGARLLIAAVVVLMIILGVFAKSLRGAIVLYFAVGASAVWAVGVMGLFGIRVGLYNIIVIPVMLGVGIDTAIHLYHRHLFFGEEKLYENLATTGVMVTASTWTTVAGFSGLLFVSHLGLRSIGLLGCLGIAAAWLSITLMLPYLLVRFVPVRQNETVFEDNDKTAKKRRVDGVGVKNNMRNGSRVAIR